MAGTTLKLNVQGLDPQASDPQQQIPQAPPPPPPPLNFAQFASNPLAQQKVQAMVPGLPPPPPPAPQMASAGPPPPVPSARPSAPSAQPPAQAPMQSMPDWQQANPGMQEQKLSGLQKALQIAAGIIHGGAPGGVAAGQAIHQHDLPSGLTGIDQQRYQQQVVQPYQAQLGIADTQAQMQQRQALADKADTQADSYALQTLTAPQAAALGNPALEGTQMSARDVARLLGAHDTATIRAGAQTTAATTRADATTTAAATRAGGQVDAANIRANAPKGRAKGAGMGALPAAGTPGFDALVTAIGEGRQPLPRGSSARTLALAQAVNAKYPHYDATTFNTHQASEKNMTSGAAGQAINSFNTALQHLGQAEQNMPANGQYPIANHLHNVFLRASGNPALSAFDTDRVAVSSEIAKAYKGGVINKEEHDQYQDLLSPDASPSQMKANFAELKNLLSGKLESYQYQRQQGQPGTQGGPIMSPGAASVMNEGSGGYTNLHINRQTNQTIGTKKGDTSGKWYDTKTGQEYTGGR